MRRTNLIPNEVARMQSRFTFKTQSDYLLFVASTAIVVICLAVSILQLAGIGIFTYKAKTAKQKLASVVRSLEENKKSRDNLDKQIKGWQEKTAQAEKRIAFLNETMTQDVAWSKVLEKINTLVPPRLWLVKLYLSPEAIKIKGNTYDNVLISAFISNLSESGAFGDINLNYTQKKKSKQESAGALAEEVVEFELFCRLNK